MIENPREAMRWWHCRACGALPLEPCLTIRAELSGYPHVDRVEKWAANERRVRLESMRNPDGLRPDSNRPVPVPVPNPSQELDDSSWV